jgi:hypothetical protein
MNGLPCVWLQDEGGTRAYTPLPDTQAVSYGITDIRESNIQLYDPRRFTSRIS